MATRELTLLEELAKIRSQEGFCDWIKTLPHSELIVGDLTESETVELFAGGKKVATFEDTPLPKKSFAAIDNHYIIYNNY